MAEAQGWALAWLAGGERVKNWDGRMMVGVKFICALFWWWWKEEGGNEVRRDGRCTALTVHGEGVQQYRSTALVTGGRDGHCGGDGPAMM
jgi:hypothetical protein